MMDPYMKKGNEGEGPAAGAGLPSASTSYPYPNGSDRQDVTQCAVPTAPPQDADEGGNDFNKVSLSPPPGDNGVTGMQSQSHLHQDQQHHAGQGQVPPVQPSQQPPRQRQQLPVDQSYGSNHNGQTHVGGGQSPHGSPLSIRAGDPTARHVTIKVQEKSLLEAYLLWFPLGIIGLHQFYLGRIGMGFLYFFTFGLFGIGWLADLCLLPYLVRKTNEKRRADAARGYVLYGGSYEELNERSLCSAYLFWLPPVGIFGGHHYYLGRIGYGAAYSLTLGLFGFGWLCDFCRMCTVTKRTNEEIRSLRSGRSLSRKPEDRMHLDDAYLLAFPLGFLGLHHFYMRRWGFGIIYFLTMGCMGVGFLVDLFRLPFLMQRTKRELAAGDKKFHMDDAYVLWFPLGFLGIHHFYLQRWVWGIAYFLTFGFFGIGWLIDFCRIPSLVRKANEHRQVPSYLLPVSQTPQQRPSQPATGYSNEQPSGAGSHAPGGNPPSHGSYGAMSASQGQSHLAVYAFPLDQHGNPVWTEGMPWGGGQNAGAMIRRDPAEPPPPYSAVPDATR